MNIKLFPLRTEIDPPTTCGSILAGQRSEDMAENATLGATNHQKDVENRPHVEDNYVGTLKKIE